MPVAHHDEPSPRLVLLFGQHESLWLRSDDENYEIMQRYPAATAQHNRFSLLAKLEPSIEYQSGDG